MHFSSERILMKIAVTLVLREIAFDSNCNCVSRGGGGVTSVVSGNCITSYEMSAERVILVPSVVVTKS
jgi:hypothetical protein